jgi:hypothetical protein
VPVEVIVPWLPGCPHRERAWNYLEPLYEWPVTIAQGGSPWVKAEAVTPAVDASDAEIVVVADADCHTNGLSEAIAAVRRGAPWAIPHRGVYRLAERGMEDFYAGADPMELPLTQPAYRGYPGGGFVVARKHVLQEVPLDPRFVGWGYEDESWARALKTIIGNPWRGDAPLIHLWHPPQPRRDRNHGSRESELLCLRYVAAEHKPEEMRAILREFQSDDRKSDYAGVCTDPS